MSETWWGLVLADRTRRHRPWKDHWHWQSIGIGWRSTAVDMHHAVDFVRISYTEQSDNTRPLRVPRLENESRSSQNWSTSTPTWFPIGALIGRVQLDARCWCDRSQDSVEFSYCCSISFRGDIKIDVRLGGSRTTAWKIEEGFDVRLLLTTGFYCWRWSDSWRWTFDWIRQESMRGQIYRVRRVIKPLTWLKIELAFSQRREIMNWERPESSAKKIINQWSWCYVRRPLPMIGSTVVNDVLRRGVVDESDVSIGLVLVEDTTTTRED